MSTRVDNIRSVLQPENIAHLDFREIRGQVGYMLNITLIHMLEHDIEEFHYGALAIKFNYTQEDVYLYDHGYDASRMIKLKMDDFKRMLTNHSDNSSPLSRVSRLVVEIFNTHDSANVSPEEFVEFSGWGIRTLTTEP